MKTTQITCDHCKCGIGKKERYYEANIDLYISDRLDGDFSERLYFCINCLDKFIKKDKPKFISK